MHRITADYHMHSKYSPDSCASIRELCESACQKGLKEIAVTDHFEFFSNPIFNDSRYLPETVLNGQRELKRLREEYEGRLIIRNGVEIGQPQTDSEYAWEIMKTLSFDYVIGSVHKLSNLDLGKVAYPDEVIPDRVRKNLEMLYELADCYDFDCLGHLDIIKRYAANQGKQVDLMDYREELVPILRRVIERGKGIELNTSGLRQAAKEALPSLAILKLYRSLGGEILTVGSDAHAARDVAADFDTALEVVLEAGFSYLAVFEKRNSSFYPIG